MQQKHLFGLFGIYRYGLASAVVISHVGPWAGNFIGGCGVFAFYMLSGYVVTYILCNHYLLKPHGIRYYAINRALRIFPLYWCVLLLNGILIVISKDSSPLPHGLWQWLANISTLGLISPLGYFHANAILGVSWTLSIEIFYWAIIPMLLRYAMLRRLAVTFAILYTLALLPISVGKVPFITTPAANLRQFSMFAAGLPFALGMYVFLYKGINRLPALMLLPILVICGFSVYAGQLMPDWMHMLTLFLPVNMVVIWGLAQLDQSSFPQKIRWLDNRLGDISYPVYLLHMPVATIIKLVLPAVNMHTESMFCYVLFGSSVGGYILHLMIEVPVNNWRTAIKYKNQLNSIKHHIT